MKGAMYESLLVSCLPPLFVYRLPFWHLSLHVERHVNPHLSLGHSATWAVSNRICSGLMSLTTQRCKPHTHLATRCDTMAIRKRMLRRSTPPKQQASNASDDYRLPTPTEITSIFCIWNAASLKLSDWYRYTQKRHSCIWPHVSLPKEVQRVWI